LAAATALRLGDTFAALALRGPPTALDFPTPPVARPHQPFMDPDTVLTQKLGVISCHRLSIYNGDSVWVKITVAEGLSHLASTVEIISQVAFESGDYYFCVKTVQFNIFVKTV